MIRRLKDNGIRNYAITSLFFAVLIFLITACTSDDTSLYLVRDGEATAVIVKQEGSPATAPERGNTHPSQQQQATEQAVQEAIDEFQYHIERATGTRLPVVSSDELDGIANDDIRVLIGPGTLTRSLLPDLEASTDDPADETYRMEYIDNHLVLTGRNPDPIQWSVHRFLDQYMGVRWLWPGKIGTYVPQTSSVSFPAELSITNRPPLQFRQLRLRTPDELSEEASEWETRHMLGGERGDLRVGHGFQHWVEKYYDDHPDLFAQDKNGFTHRMASDGKRPHHNINLCLSNPEVDKFIIREWQEAGTPDHWNVGNNDLGGRYCLCDGCRAMDEPPNQSLDDLWAGTAYVTARHVRFWQRLLNQMQEINPDVTLGAFAFQQYRFAPPPDTDLEDMIISVVSAHDEYDDWLAWYETGARLYLRPNWWHTGVVAPHIPLHIQGKYFKLAYNHGMEAFDFDSLIGYWGAQGSSYYLIARLGYRPDLSVDEVISEFTDAFGSAKPAIREYLAYWEKRTEKADYRLRSTDMYPPREDGLYDKIVEEQGLPNRVQLNNWWILPYLYPEEVVGEAHAILDRAEQLAADDGGYVQERIQFLRDGLRYLEAAREVFRLGTERTRPDDSDETWEKYVRARDYLESLRDDVISPHVVWDGISERERNYRPWDELWERE